MPRRVRAGLIVVVALVGIVVVRFDAQSQGKTIEWRYFGGDKAFTRCSPADQINRDNVKDLRIVWRRPAVTPSFKEAFRADSGERLSPCMHRGRKYIVVPVGAKDHPAEFVALALAGNESSRGGSW